jgi:hypothetical protein
VSLAAISGSGTLKQAVSNWVTKGGPPVTPPLLEPLPLEPLLPPLDILPPLEPLAAEPLLLAPLGVLPLLEMLPLDVAPLEDPVAEPLEPVPPPDEPAPTIPPGWSLDPQAQSTESAPAASHGKLRLVDAVMMLS